MKFVLALVVYLAFAAAIGAGLILAVQGRSVWLLLISLLVFGITFARYGCRAH